MADAKTWRKRIRQGEAAREPFLKIWTKLRSKVAGEMLAGNPLRGTPAKLHNSHVRITVARLVPRDRRIEVLVTPKRPDDEEHRWTESARILADRLNTVIDATRMVKEVRKAATASQYSVGVLKVIMPVHTGIRKAVPSEHAPDQTVVVDLDKDRVEGKEFADPGLPTALWCPAGRLVVAPGSNTLDEAPWIAFEAFRSLASLKADPKFAAVADQLQVTHKSVPDPLGKEPEQQEEADPLSGMVQLYEIHDRSARRVLTIGGEKCGFDGLLAEAEWPDGVEGYPVAIIDFFSIEGVFWPEPALLSYDDAMTGSGRLGAHIARMANNAKTVIVYDPDHLQPKELASLAKAKDGDCVPVRGWNKVAGQVTIGSVTEEHLSVMDRLKATADEMSGIDEMRRGAAEKGAKATATEVDARVRLGEIRIDDQRSALDEAVRECVEIMAAMLLANQAALAALVLPGREHGTTVDFRDELIGEAVDFMFEMKTTAVDRVDPAIRLKRLQDSLAVLRDPGMVQQLAAEGVHVRVAPLVVEYLRAMDLDDPEQYVVRAEAQQDQQTQLAMREDAEMLASGQPLPINADDDHAAHLAVHAADFQQSQNEAIAAHVMTHEIAAKQAGGGGPAAGPAGGGAAGGVGQAAALQAEANRV